MNNTWSGRLREYKNKGKFQLSNPKSGPGRLRERSLTRLLLQSLVTVRSNEVSQRRL